MKIGTACFFLLSSFLIGACGDAGIGAEPCVTTAWINEEGSLRVRQFSDGQICSYLNDVRYVLNSDNMRRLATNGEMLSRVREVISSGNDITERGTYEGTLDLVARDPFPDPLSLRGQAIKLLMNSPENGGFGVTYIDAHVLVPMTLGEDLSSALARLDNGESLTASQEVIVAVYRMWTQTVDIVSDSIPSLQILEATVPAEQEDTYVVEFQGTEILIGVAR